jgi:hypothetical protein
VVEPVFGQIKQARGFRQFLLRGVKKVRAEWAMIARLSEWRERALARGEQRHLKAYLKERTAKARQVSVAAGQHLIRCWLGVGAHGKPHRQRTDPLSAAGGVDFTVQAAARFSDSRCLRQRPERTKKIQ